jgi:ADP-ribosyl-[dinitrogen reductase] hydrolase
LAGAFYGEEGIPEDWREKVSHHELIVSFAEKLFRPSIHADFFLDVFLGRA